MVTQQLKEFVAQQRKEGLTDDVIRTNLRSVGWLDADINEAISGQTTPIIPINTVHHSGSKLGVIIAIILVLAIGGGAYAYLQKAGSGKAKNHTFAEIVTAVQGVKSAAYSSEFSVEGDVLDNGQSPSLMGLLSIGTTTNKSPHASLHVTMSGSNDIHDATQLKSQSSIKVNAEYQGQTFDLEGQVKIIGDAIYFNISTLPKEVSQFIKTEKILNNWIHVKIPNANTYNPSMIGGYYSNPLGADKETQEQVLKLVQNAHLITVTGTSSGDKIDGVQTDVMEFTLDKDGIVQFISDFATIANKDLPPVTEADKKQVRDTLDKLEFKGKLYVGRENALPYKYVISIIPHFPEVKNMEIKINSTLSKYNEALPVVAPEKFVEFESLVSDIYGGQSIDAFAQANNSQRWSNVNTILNGVNQYQADNKGVIPASITTTLTEICKTGASSCSGLVDLSVLTKDETYLLTIPVDPRCPEGCAANGTGYSISKTSSNRIRVSAPNAELNQAIEVTR